MRFLFILLGLLVGARGIRYDYGVERSSMVKRQTSSLPLTGVHNLDGSTGLRREIRDLETDPTTWNLYLLGLDFMQSLDQSQMNSWYQIAGNSLFLSIRLLLIVLRNSWSTVYFLR